VPPVPACSVISSATTVCGPVLERSSALLLKPSVPPTSRMLPASICCGPLLTLICAKLLVPLAPPASVMPAAPAWIVCEPLLAVIVGAGIAGLTAAWTLRDRDVLVLEATDRVGGRMRSEARGPYWLNLGAHLFGGPGSLLDRLVVEVGLETRPIPGNRMGLAFRGRVLGSGRPESYPLRLPLSPAARLSFIRAGLRLRRAALRVGELRTIVRLTRNASSSAPAQTSRRFSEWSAPASD